MRCDRGVAEDIAATDRISSATSQAGPDKVSAVKREATEGGFAVDLKTVRASGSWSGAMQGDFTATRQLERPARETAAESGSDGSEDDTASSPVAPAGWKRAPAGQVQLAFSGPAQALHQLFARLDFRGEGLQYYELVDQLSQDADCARMFELPAGDDAGIVLARRKALCEAFADLPEAAGDRTSAVDAEGFVRLVMGATRHAQGSSAPDGPVVSFTEPGTLGLRFTTNKTTGSVDIIEIKSGTQAAQHPQLSVGLVLLSVNGASLVGRNYTVRKTSLYAPFIYIYIMHRFTKTGSGQT
jgi:hypothetical protein